jgi:hypothetical protein
MKQNARLCAGELVEVLSKSEILSTLDKNGQLEGLPFMPEMFAYCGQRLRVSKRAHKTCDPSLGTAGRKLPNSVHLENVRCDGLAHDGCEAGCLIFWKEAWLRRVTGDVNSPAIRSTSSTGKGACTEQDVIKGTKAPPSDPATQPLYVCQNTHLKYATTHLPWWDFRQFGEHYTSGNVKLSELTAGFVFFLWHSLTHAGLGIGSAMLWIYDSFQRIRGGSPYPWRAGAIPKGAPTPSQKLDLEPGEMVRVKPYSEIIETLDEKWHNRGMYFDGEMVPFTEGNFKVAKRVRRIIDERTGKMLNIKSDAIILENVACQARYSTCRRFCPRAIFPYWREIWLERVGSSPNEPTTSGCSSARQ